MNFFNFFLIQGKKNILTPHLGNKIHARSNHQPRWLEIKPKTNTLGKYLKSFFLDLVSSVGTVFWILFPGRGVSLKYGQGISAGLQEFNQLIQVYQPGTSGTKYMDYG